MNVPWTDLDQYVEAFERARASGPVANLAQFAPTPTHPLHVAVLSELVRVDLEMGWSEGRPTALADYRRRYPRVFADGARAREIAFEEYRLRRQAGHRCSPIEYRGLGFEIGDWPSLASSDLDLSRANGAQTDDPITSAARTYSESRLHNGPPSADSARLSPHIALFRAAYLKDPAVADRLARAVQCWPEIGEVFCGFRLISELGRGAFGRVFLARQGDLANREVALKVACDIRGEPQRLARLQHTNIVPIYSVHAAAPFQAICMPYFGGTTLDRMIAEPALMPQAWRNGRQYDVVVGIAERLADGLAHAHDRNILHRDIKPANVLITADGEPMLLDFNLAADATALEAEALHIGGTLPYMSPEVLEALQAGKSPPLGATSDVYAFGLVLWELLSGRPAFSVRTQPVREMLPAMIAERRRPPDIRSAVRDVPPALAAIIARCLAPEPSRRYLSARALQDDLNCQLHHRPLRHTREPSLRERLTKWRRRNPRLSVAAVAALILVPLALVGWVRSRELAAARALQSLSEFRHEKLLATTLLKVPDISPAERDRGMDLARQAIARFHDGSGRSSLAWLPAAEQAHIRRDLGEMFLVSAGASLRSASPAEGTAGLDEAWRLNFLAEPLLRGSPDESAVFRQRALISRLRGTPVEVPCGSNNDGPTDRYGRIESSWEAGRLRDAIRLIREALDNSPDDAFLWYALADAHVQLEQYDLAYAYLDASRALFPDFYRTYYQRGIVELHRQRAAAARADFDAALRLEPRFFPALMQRAIARAQIGDVQGAMADLDRARDMAQAVLPQPPAQIEFMRARLLADAGQPNAARRALEIAFRMPPIDADDWVVRGLARVDSDPNSALTDFGQALKRNPKHRMALRNQANVLAESLGRLTDSVAVLDRLIAIAPDSAVDLAGRGVVLARLGKRDEAHRDARAALHASQRAFNRYQVAGIYALTAKQNPSDALEAIRLLASAFQDGVGLDLCDRDADLDPIRKRADFRRVVDAARTLKVDQQR